MRLFRPGVLEHLISLINLDLGENKISTLKPEVFFSNVDLEVLVLDSNKVNTSWRILALYD